MHSNRLLCLDTRSISACMFPPGIFPLTCCDKCPLILTKWIELCDGHIRHPQEKKISCESYNMILLCHNGPQVFRVCAPTAPSSIQEHRLPKLRLGRCGSREDGGNDRREQEEGKDGGGGDKMTLVHCLEPKNAHKSSSFLSHSFTQRS